MTLKITAPAAGANVQAGIVTVTGTSTQKVDGVELAAQSFSVTRDLTGKAGQQILSVQNSAGDAASVTVNIPANESANGAIITSTTGSLVDHAGNVWTLRDGGASLGLQVFENGVAAGVSQSVIRLAYIGGVLRQTNIDGNSWDWIGGAWVAVISGPAESADGATLSNNTDALYDAALNAWTLHNDPTYANVVYENGAQIGNTDHVITLLYYGKAFYVLGDDGNWYAFANGAWTMRPNGADPRTGTVTPPTPSGKPLFWGVNGHIDWKWTPNARGYLQSNWPTLISKMQDLGLKLIRCGYDGTTATDFKNFINNYATPAGIKLSPCLLQNYQAGGNEQGAYNVGFSLGQNVATNLKGLVPWYEIGNEDDAYAINTNNPAGNSNSHYDNGRFQIVRGWWRGLIAGIKSVDTTTPIVSGGITWLHTALLDMLWNGTQPDGSTGHPTVRWDITACHWYVNSNSNNDNPENAAGFNLLAHLRDAFGKPIHVNEYGVNFNQYAGNETNIKNALVGPNLMAKWAAVAETYGIEHTAMYQLVDAAGSGVPTNDNEMNFGLCTADNANKARYAAVKTFIAANPK